MNLHGIVAVSGKPGLWKALAQNKTGFILESLDATKTKLVVNISTAKLAALDEITIFGEDEDLKLTEILEKMKTASSAPDVKANGEALRTYFYEVAPDHDESRVYSSDIKKIITWYGILKDRPEFSEVKAVVEPSEETLVSEETNLEESAASGENLPAPAAKKKAGKK